MLGKKLRHPVKECSCWRCGHRTSILYHVSNLIGFYCHACTYELTRGGDTAVPVKQRELK